MICRGCGHTRDNHSHGQGCTTLIGPGDQPTYCRCNHRKEDAVAFLDLEGH
jgi:hypothetical protein